MDNWRPLDKMLGGHKTVQGGREMYLYSAASCGAGRIRSTEFSPTHSRNMHYVSSQHEITAIFTPGRNQSLSSVE
jgi:hypothetical protein